MTSNLSSAKQFRTSFVQALKKYCFHGILVFVLLLPFFEDIYSMYRHHEMYLSGMLDYDYIGNYVFALSRRIYTEETGYVCLVMGLSGMFLALHCWRFLHVKKMLNVYCSLGISQKDLFLSRFLACLVHLVAPVVLIFAGLFVSNLMLFGFSPELLTATVIYALSFIAIGLLAYAMTTLCMCVTGASVESFLCSGCLIALPVTLFYSMKYLAAALLKGSAVEHWLRNVATRETVHRGIFLPDAEYLDFFYPVSDFRFSDGFAWEKTEGWLHPGWEYPLLWFAVGVLLSVLCFVCFIRRKNENAGFLGKNPALVGVSCLSLVFLLAIPSYYIISSQAAANLLLFAGTLILFLVYTVIMAILLRSKKKLARAMPVALAVCAVFVLICSVFLTGGLGFENRIPDKQDIESVSISCAGYQQFAEAGDSFSEDYYDDMWYEAEELQKQTAEAFMTSHLSYFYATDAYVVTGLTDEKDIDTVLAVHSKMAQAEDGDLSLFGIPVAFQYKLKNGKTLTRYYETATPEVLEMLAVYDTHEDVKTAFEKQLNDIWIENVSLLSPAAAQVTLLPWNMLDNGLNEDLRTALIKDFKDGTLCLMQAAETAPLGYISLSGNIRVVEEEYYYESYDYAYATTAVAIEDPYVTPEFSEPKTFSLAKLAENYDYCDFTQLYPVFADMKNTLAVLEEYDVLQYFTAEQMPVSAKLVRTPFADRQTRADIQNEGQWWYYRSNMFRGSYTRENSGLSLQDVMPDGSFTTDAAVIEQLVKNSFMMNYPVTLDGSMVAFAYADGTTVLTYVPIAFVPENLR